MIVLEYKIFIVCFKTLNKRYFIRSIDNFVIFENFICKLKIKLNSKYNCK